MKENEKPEVSRGGFPWNVPDVFYPDAALAYQDLVDERSISERLASYHHALRPYFLHAVQQVNDEMQEHPAGSQEKP
ncbi:MAG: hypothetical protein OXU40_00735 [Nitrospira sp.]|nr:hypothetical protein [Nitrospira sp.]